MAERRYLEVTVGINIVMVLDHRTVEVFDRTAASTSEVARWHVEHIAVKAKPSKSGLKLTIGNRLADDSIAVAESTGIADCSAGERGSRHRVLRRGQGCSGVNRQKTFGADDSGSLVEHVVRCHEDRAGRTFVGISGIEASGKSTIADELAAGISKSGHDFIMIHGDEFSTAKAVRNKDPDTVRGYLEDAYDYSNLSSRVMVPLRLAEVTEISYVSTDPETDESVVSKPRVPDRAIVIVEGVLLFAD